MSVFSGSAFRCFPVFPDISSTPQKSPKSPQPTTLIVPNQLLRHRRHVRKIGRMLQQKLVEGHQDFLPRPTATETIARSRRHLNGARWAVVDFCHTAKEIFNLSYL